MTNQEIKNQFIQFIEDGIEEGMIGYDSPEDILEDEETSFHYFEMFYGEDEDLAEETFDRIFG